LVVYEHLFPVYEHLFPVLCSQANIKQAQNYGCLVEKEDCHEVISVPPLFYVTLNLERTLYDCEKLTIWHAML
jgi:hypothetical protein